MNISIKNLIVLLLITSITSLSAGTSRNNVKLLEASEDIKFISQQIVKDYLFLSKNRQKAEVIKSLYLSVTTLEEKLRVIASHTKSDDTKNILTFLAFSRDEMRETIAKQYTKENASLMLDNGEVLLEGADSIAREHAYQFSAEEKMFIKLKNMAYLLERMAKYYMAYQSGFNDENSAQELHLAMKQFDDELMVLNKYVYLGESSRNLENINQYWSITRNFYLLIEKRKLPNILYISTQHLEKMMAKLELYHSKNQ